MSYHFAPPPLPEAEEISAGETLAPDTPVSGCAPIVEVLRTIYDPEIPVDIYELGLIYTTEQDKTGDVTISMSLTSPGCPVAGTLPLEVAEQVAALAGVGRVALHLVWDPPWTPERMTEDARLALGFF